MADYPAVDDLTGAEIAIAERTAGVSVDSLEDHDYPSAPIMGALAWVAKKRHEPTLAYDDFMQRYTLTEIAEILGGDDADDPSASQAASPSETSRLNARLTSA